LQNDIQMPPPTPGLSILPAKAVVRARSWGLTEDGGPGSAELAVIRRGRFTVTHAIVLLRNAWSCTAPSETTIRA
jgi:hypothetical protein